MTEPKSFATTRAAAAAAVAAVTLTLSLTNPAHAACMTDAEVSALFDAYSNKLPATNPAGLSSEDGECSRTKLLRMLGLSLGEPIGYKAGLTNPAVQKRFNATAPVWGALYANMMLADGAKLPAAFGARPLFEADMLVRISSAAINAAKTPEDVLAAIDQIVPAIELPDMVVQNPGALNGAAIAAINVGARLFVSGKAIAVPATRAERFQLLDALRDFTAIVKADGAEVDRGKGSDVLGHPLAAVAWLAQDLARTGVALKPGDMVSLGSFSRLLPPKAGQSVELVYDGLPGNPVVKLSFQ